ncbi:MULTISPECIES: HU family DNA-binding protein [Paraburkholderia]|uniref:HU family DNA-binding protein n=1 Tax=Paraburkholderia TaxID=1822464 RepID=UPI0022562248|nr:MULTISPECIES: HU family DNA-binding protein [Paraburkholderia]MCX4159298.1 HU family DNA-binding protein [Paraburkholderia aspalathi]MDN7168697.1 HU family DNA-binding protein [Paraburkholderia sp. SECH2]MDQ6397184.1 HU family DNA-binding protein [Paraburkholderia aspalathi]
MTEQELVDTVVAAKSESKMAIDLLIDAVTTAVAGSGIVQLIGFGSFSSGERAPRVGRRPASGKAIQIPAAKTAKFTACKMFGEAVNAS